MPKPHSNRDLEALIAEMEKSRVQTQKLRDKYERLEAAIQSMKEKRTKGRSSSDKSKASKK